MENTPSKAYRRIWQSRGRRKSGNVDGISPQTGKRGGVGERRARGQAGKHSPRYWRVQGVQAARGVGGAPPLPGQGDPYLHPNSRAARRVGAKSAPRLPPPSAPPGGEAAAPPPPPGAETLRLYWKPRRAPASSSPAAPPPAPISASRAPPAGRDLLVYRGPRTSLLPHWVGGCRSAKQGDTRPGHKAGPRPGAGRQARRFRPLRPPPRAFLPPPHPSPTPSFPTHARAAPPGREEESARGEGAGKGPRWGWGGQG